ncbi:hypothetical protein G3567_04710 [Psychroflexus sp. YR1-1]|uniref:Uncharacterized protein n=1 Tax=Psychroflexus aurantiacus TaxID=2709310 RepID=A0A6B3R6L8_9FLAO|nr:hypothetical protein [Psychroflexus aurantiacus]NEV93451.1 hypothetical protein [Psychroflexus aurantiacus]
MNHNQSKNSFDKGQAFEDFVENVLFPAQHYELMHKTNDYNQNSDRYVYDSKKPDFRFRSRLTGREFHVEAKYRSKAYKNEYDILSDTQVKSFQTIHTGKVPIFVALGYGDKANNPEYVSFIPYAINHEKKVTATTALQYNIPKQAVKSTLLDTYSEKLKLEPKTETNITSKKVSIPNKKAYWVASGVLILMASIYFVIATGTDQTSNLKERIETYYQLSDANNTKELANYISPEMTYWYGIKNPTTVEVLENIENYRSEYPYAESSLDWDSFSITEKPDGRFYATYSLNYKVKPKNNNQLKNFDLKVLTIWDQDLKLVSIKELQ